MRLVYRGTDGHLHKLWWTTGVVTHNDLTVLGAGPNAAEPHRPTWSPPTDRST